MGTYLNPGNSGFAGIRNDIYIDKSGLISLVNDTIETPRRLTCVSRPRRFGKSFAAQMLCAYYDKCRDSVSKEKIPSLLSFWKAIQMKIFPKTGRNCFLIVSDCQILHPAFSC